MCLASLVLVELSSRRTSFITLLVLAAAPLLLAALAGELTELAVPLDKKRR